MLAKHSLNRRGDNMATIYRTVRMKAIGRNTRYKERSHEDSWGFTLSLLVLDSDA
jgi:hypothetical protein